MRGLTAVVAAACLLGVLSLPGCARPEDAGPTSVATPAQPRPLPPAADGIAFIRDGRALVIRGGAEHEVAANGAEKLGVAYSADGKELLVTEVRGALRVVRMAAAGASAPGRVVLESGDGSNLGPVRAATTKGRLYHAVFGDPVNRVMVSGLALGSKSSNIALGGTFSGEFDVDATGGSIVYTGTGQNPATVMLRSGSTERPLAAGLATAFTPSFSKDGERICLTGSERAGAPISLYVVDVESGDARVIAGTEGLNPTSPVFSPDGESVAFRSATDGALWIVPFAGGEPDKLAITADEAPISW